MLSQASEKHEKKFSNYLTKPLPYRDAISFQIETFLREEWEICLGKMLASEISPGDVNDPVCTVEK